MPSRLPAALLCTISDSFDWELPAFGSAELGISSFESWVKAQVLSFQALDPGIEEFEGCLC